MVTVVAVVTVEFIVELKMVMIMVCHGVVKRTVVMVVVGGSGHGGR